MAHIHLIRHGQASFGGANYDKLSPTGERQSAVVGEHLKLRGIPFAAIYSGELVRQIDTAEIARRAHGALPERQTDAAFNEYDANGLFSGYLPLVLRQDTELADLLTRDRTLLFKDKKIFQRAFAQLAAHWLAGDAPVTGRMEPWAEFVARVEAGLRRLHDNHPRDAHVAVFTSGGAIAVAVRAALQLADAMTLQVNWGVANASITRLRSRSRGVQLESFNGVTHFELLNDPAFITYR